MIASNPVAASWTPGREAEWLRWLSEKEWSYSGDDCLVSVRDAHAFAAGELGWMALIWCRALVTMSQTSTDYYMSGFLDGYSAAAYALARQAAHYGIMALLNSE